MFFNVDADDGASVRGWIAPDNPSATPRIVIVIPGRDEIEIEAKRPRNDIRDAGLHATGHVGFAVDRTVVPDIETVQDIEILEAETRLPIYRRFQVAQHLRKKFFLFDPSLMPHRRILAGIGRHFSLNYVFAERFARETMTVIINNYHCNSIFIGGRPNYNRYQDHLQERGFIRAALLRDPYEELAERMLFLSLLKKSSSPEALSRFTNGVAPLLEWSAAIEFSDLKSILDALRKLNDVQREAIASPMVRSLGCDPEERPERRHVSVALENLATMEVVGLRERFPFFRRMLEHIVGTDVFGDAEPTVSPSVHELAQTLRRIGIAADLLEHDLVLYAHARDAVLIGVTGEDSTKYRDAHSM